MPKLRHKNQMKLQSIGKGSKPPNIWQQKYFLALRPKQGQIPESISLHCDAFRSQRPSSWKSMILNRMPCHAPCNDQLIIAYQIVETNKVANMPKKIFAFYSLKELWRDQPYSTYLSNYVVGNLVCLPNYFNHAMSPLKAHLQVRSDIQISEFPTVLTKWIECLW